MRLSMFLFQWSNVFPSGQIARGEVGQNVLTSSEYESAIVSVFGSLGFKLESFITSRLPLLKLPSDVLEALRQGRIEYTKAQAIAKVKDQIARQELLSESIEHGLSLVQIRDRIAALPQSPKQSENSLKSQVDTTFRSLKKSSIWKDPKKQKRLEKLMQQIESLISSV